MCFCLPRRSELHPSSTSCPLETVCVRTLSELFGYGCYSQSGRADQLLPLSPAVCCRPCLPTENARNNSNNFVAVMTSSCHHASLSNQETCGGGNPATSFLQGFEHSQKATPSSYYPFGNAECCTPTLLMQSGEVKPLRRCMCEVDALSPTHVSCANQVCTTPSSLPETPCVTNITTRSH